jgi:hypothetical protein
MFLFLFSLAAPGGILPLAHGATEHLEANHSNCHFCPDSQEPVFEPYTASPDVFETYPDGSLPEPASEPEFAVAGVTGPVAPAAGQPPGALSGRIVYTSAGHGWILSSGTWGLQRAITHEMNEDYGTLDQMNIFAQYAFNAGATVVPFRPLGNQNNEVIVDNVDAQVIWSGTWNNSSQSVYYGKAGEVPYRWASLSPTETATATYVPNIPQAGFYPVYTWALHGNDRTFQLYRIRHTGGESEVRIPHHMVGSGWVYLGNYYFAAGSNPVTGSVVISNLQPSPARGSVVIADAIRFGNGMSNHGSGYPKEEEASLYWVQNMLGQGQSYTGGSVSAPPRWAREMNREQNGTMFDRIYLGFHTNAHNGAARGAMGLHNDNWPGTSTPNQRRWAQIVARETTDQMVALNPHLEVNWHDRGAAGSIWSHTSYPFGEINNSTILSQFDATIIEVAYHDNLSDARLLRDPKVRDWTSRASYRAIVKYMNEFGGGPLAFSPAPPRNTRAIANASGGIVVSWDVPAPSVGADSPASYVVYRSTDGYGFGNPVFVNGATTTSVTLTGLPADTELYFRVAARNAGGESFPSETVGVRRPSNSEAKRVLFVNGYNRIDRFINIRQTPQAGNYRAPGHNNNTGTMDRVLPRSVNSFDYVVQHGRAIAAAGIAFDSCRDTSVTSNQVNLADYDIVVWATGQNSSSNRTFTTAAQNRISTYLTNGGTLFASGSEIAYDLDRPAGPSAGDRAFLHNTLRAAFAAANSQSYTVAPVQGTLFSGLSNASFDSGTSRIYPVRSPDVVTPVGAGAQATLNFTGGAGGAAVQYDGSAGGGRVVLMTFPFETITNANLRNQYMARVLNFLTEPLVEAPPAILAQPQSQVAIEGSEVTLSVQASGVPAPSFQWQFNEVDIPGETGATLTLTATQVAHGGSYRVIVSNTLASVTSSAVTLTVQPLREKPAFISARATDDGFFEAILVGKPGAWFLVETSPDLHSWTPFSTLKIHTAPVSLLDAEWRSFDQRFYRSREVPAHPVTAFERFANGTAALFQNPGFSGSTSSHIATGGSLPNFARVATDFPAGSDQSHVLHASWSFAATTNPWLRLTTFDAPNIPNPTVDFRHGLRLNVYVDRPIYLVLGLRETNTTAALGADGGTTGSIESVGGTTNNNVSPPLGRFIPAGEWTTVHFFIPYEPVRNFASGNGILESTTGKGTLEHLGIVPADGTGIYNLYLENIRSVPLSP